MEFVESIYRGDRYKLVTSLNRPRERARNRSLRANDGLRDGVKPRARLASDSARRA